MAFHRGDLGGLVLERVEAVQVAQDQLRRRQHGDQPERHGQADLGVRHRARLKQMPGADARDHEGVVRNAAVTMCARRYGNDGLNTTSHQLVT